jgi:hypothetical protein
MRNFLKISLFSILILTGVNIIFTGCNKDIVDTDPSLKLEFSNDSIIFDTVFTTIGSATKQLRVYNKSNSKIVISEIRLSMGESSAYRINVDGEHGTTIKDIEIEANDSIYIFARVTIDPTNENNPFVIEDDLLFLTNENHQEVKLIAWGQNAHYIVADTYTPGFPQYKIIADSLQTITWTNEKPYVIYGYAVINSYGTLIIEQGTKVHFHAESGLWAYSDGLLKVNGTIDEPVIFSGDRLEEEYRELPGQWDRIWLMESTPGENHSIKNALIKNSFIGLQTESFLRYAQDPLVLENVTVQNMTGIGIFSRIYNIQGGNIVVANCGGYCMALTGGGNYNFIQTTIADYWQYGIRRTPALFLNNFLLDTLDNPVPIPINFFLGNSIVYGGNDEEFETEMVEGEDSTYYFNYVILKTKRDTLDHEIFDSVWANKNPKFVNYRQNDYRLDSASPAINKGNVEIANLLPEDILGNSRLPEPDLGAFQYVPGQNDDKVLFNKISKSSGLLLPIYLKSSKKEELFKSPANKSLPNPFNYKLLK